MIAKNQHSHYAAEGRIFAFMSTLCHSERSEESHILSIFKKGDPSAYSLRMTRKD